MGEEVPGDAGSRNSGGGGEENEGEEKERRGGEGKIRRRGENDRIKGGEGEGEGGGVVLGDAGSENRNPGRRRGGKMDRRSVGEDNKGEEERGLGGEETEGKNEERMRGRTVFLVMQVLEIPAGGRGFPLVQIIYQVKASFNILIFIIGKSPQKFGTPIKIISLKTIFDAQGKI